jgi:hypothetical protein
VGGHPLISKLGCEMPIPTFCEETDLWENSYFYFVECVRALASAPADACATYGHFNVASELWLEVRAGKGLSKSQKNRLSSEQTRLIDELAGSLEFLPDDACHYTESARESLVQLEHEAWENLRALARKLLVALEPITESNRMYIYSEKGDWTGFY